MAANPSRKPTPIRGRWCCCCDCVPGVMLAAAYHLRGHWLALAAALLLVLGIAAPASPADNPDSNKVAILYDGPTNAYAKGYLHALFLQNLLGHFNLRADLIPLAAYQPGQLARHRAGFFIGAVDDTLVPSAVLADIRATGQPFAWMGQHIGQLLSTREARRQFGFAFEEYSRDLGYTQVIYKETALTKGETDLNVVSVTDPKRAEVVAVAVNRNNVRRPYVLRSGRFWYFADTPMSYMSEGDRYLAACDLLHDILEIQHEPDGRALVRIEDVSVDDEPDDLRKIADLLAARHIPFQISLIPVFRDPRQGLDIRLSYRRDFVDAIHYMVSRGGTPVMHGVTHQYRGVSADEYEFWVDPGDHPIAGDSTDFVLDRLQFGLAECFGSGIYPVAFETPHYSASEADYLAIGRVFSISNESEMVAPQLNSVQFFPYMVVDRFGRRVVPEDLGYLPEGDPDPKRVIESARKLHVVRDGIASFYFHPFLDRKLLEQSVDGVIAAGYHFVSLRGFGGAVDAQGRFVVRTVSGTARVQPHNEYWRMRLFDAAGRLVKTGVSSERLTAPAEVAVDVPEGGWAALDCIRNLPRDTKEQLSWAARLRQWWDSLHPEPQAGFAAPARKFIAGKDAWILWSDRPPVPAARDQESYRTVLEAFGYRVKQVNIRDFVKAPAQNETILVVPRAATASLSQAQHQKILQYLTDGGQVVMEGRQPWLERLGFEFSGRQMPVSRLSDPDYPEMTLSWRPEEVVEQFTAPEGVHELMVDPASGQPVALAGGYRSGHYIYLAAPLDTHTADGTSHYPYFPRYLSDTFGPASSLRGQHVEAYFDPSYRPGADLNRLAVSWRQSGIRTIYVAAWLFTRRYSFPYAEFIHACHRNGVSVYAWFVFPEVTQKMWDEHPEWREKTAAGTDGQVGWRYAMNFQNPACFRASMDWMDDVLRSNEWDGVNVTELNFDAALENWLRPEVFVPMNDEVRADFRRKAGFDPLLLFKPGSPNDLRANPAALEKFLRYREDIVTDWHRRVLAEIEPLRKERGWEVIVTALDSLHLDYAKPRLGVDSRRIAGLMKDFPFTLQVEDPVQFWMRAPDRYLRFAKTYSKLVRDPRRLMFDVNVMPNRDISSTFLPSATATGVELALTLAAASTPSGRVAVYSENTVPVQDWPLLRMALARPATITAAGDGWQVASPGSVLLSPAENRSYYVDGRLWPAGSVDGMLAPAGRHTISAERSWWRFFDPVALPTRVLSCTADLLEARVDATSLMLRYSSPGRAVIQLSEQPRDILVDDKRPVLTAEPSGSYWAVTLPGGEHRVTIVTNTPAGVAVDAWSWVSASVIAAFGALTTLLMVGIYLHIRLRRLGKRRG